MGFGSMTIPIPKAGGAAFTSGAGNWVVPAGVTRIKYTLLGAGGGVAASA